jgi:hypothetical protein
LAQVLADLREKLASFYSDIGRPSVDPELMLRMLMVGYCYGIRSERRLCEEEKAPHHFAAHALCVFPWEHDSTASIANASRARQRFE